MGKLRTKEQNNKIRTQATNDRICCSEQYPWFSFKSLTSNSNYNLSSLKQGTEREATLHGLFEKLHELSSNTWLHWTQQPKKTGLETLKYEDIGFKACSSITNDATVYIFRFDTHLGSGHGRIIGYKDAPCATLHIIGFDLDFSAYKH